MNSEAYGTTTFCDDIRFETNGKITLIGCYTGELNFGGPKPGLLPTFAALVNIRIPVSVELSTLTVRVTKDVLSETEIMFETSIDIPEESRQIPEGEELAEERVLFFSMPLQWSPVEVVDEGHIKVRAFLDGKKEVRVGALKLNFNAGPDQDQEE